MEDSFIVVAVEQAGSDDKTFSLCSAAGEAEAHVRSLVEDGTPPETIRVYRARPLALRRRHHDERISHHFASLPAPSHRASHTVYRSGGG